MIYADHLCSIIRTSCTSDLNWRPLTFIHKPKLQLGQGISQQGERLSQGIEENSYSQC